MTEEQIELRVERMFDQLNKKFMSGRLTEEEYRVECKKISDWADQQYKNN